MVPLSHCERKSFAEIDRTSSTTRAAREGKIAISDLEGGVFTISNAASTAPLLSTPNHQLPPPAILGLHNIQQRPVVATANRRRPMMYPRPHYDHA